MRRQQTEVVSKALEKQPTISDYASTTQRAGKPKTARAQTNAAKSVNNLQKVEEEPLAEDDPLVRASQRHNLTDE